MAGDCCSRVGELKHRRDRYLLVGDMELYAFLTAADGDDDSEASPAAFLIRTG